MNSPQTESIFDNYELTILSDLDSCGDVDLCSSMAVCVDVPGGTECQCMAGYEGNGITCKDIDECLNKSICDHNQICWNAEGSYFCADDKGICITKSKCSDCKVRKFKCK